MPYPTSLPTWYTAFSTPITLQAMQHTTRHKNMESDIVELTKKVGTGASIPGAGKFLKSTSAGESSWTGIDISDVSGTTPVSKGGTNATTIATARTSLSVYSKAEIDAIITSAVNAGKESLNPVGSLYFNADNAANPSSLLGFGTWEAYAQGRVPVGKATSGTFSVAGATLGAETHTLTVAEMPSHSHGQKVTANTGPNGRKDFQAEGPSGEYDQNVQTYSTGGGGSHNNIQPSIVVYIWRRTA